jgi:hypothetical protein
MTPRYIETPAETGCEPSVHGLRKEAQACSIQMWRFLQNPTLGGELGNTDDKLCYDRSIRDASSSRRCLTRSSNGRTHRTYANHQLAQTHDRAWEIEVLHMWQFGAGQFVMVWVGAFKVSALSTNWWLGCRACQYVIRSMEHCIVR